MDQDNNAKMSEEITFLGKKAWTAYVGTVFIAIILLLVVLAVWGSSWIGGLILLLTSALFVGYRVMYLRSHVLYYDDVGVWLYAGVLPWKKGINGVKWRDLDGSVYFQGLWSWLFKAYSVRIGHRFTKSNELFLTHIGRGHEASMAINDKHQELIRSGAVTN